MAVGVCYHRLRQSAPWLTRRLTQHGQTTLHHRNSQQIYFGIRERRSLMKLKMIGFCVFATCTCILLNAAEQVPIEPSVGEITYGYELTLALDKTTYSVGEPVIAKVVLKNVSDRDRT